MMTDRDIDLRVLSWKEAAAYVHLWPTHLISLVDPEDAELVAASPRPDLVRLELFVGDVTDPEHPNVATEQDIARTDTDRDGIFVTWLGWAHRQEFWWPVPRKVLTEVSSGRASWDTKVELVMAQTHRQRGVDRGRFRR